MTAPGVTGAAFSGPQSAIFPGFALDVVFKDAVSDGLVTPGIASIPDRSNGRTWTGALEVGTKWLINTTAKAPNIVGEYTGSGSQANIEFIDTVGDPLAATFGATATQSWCCYAEMTNPDGNTRCLLSMRDRLSSTALTDLEMWFTWNGTNWFLKWGGSPGTVSADLGAGGNTSPPFSGWNHWGVTESAGVCTLLKNGAALTTTTHSPSTFASVLSANPTVPLTRTIMSRDHTTNPWKGKVGRFTCYPGTALTAAQHLDWYTKTVAEIG